MDKAEIYRSRTEIDDADLDQIGPMAQNSLAFGGSLVLLFLLRCKLMGFWNDGANDKGCILDPYISNILLQ